MSVVYVSEPEELLLVNSASQGLSETTLVVPELPFTVVAYSRCLVMQDTRMSEVAVVWLDAPTPKETLERLREILGLRRATEVVFAEAGADGIPTVNSSEERLGLCAVAAALCARSRSAKATISLRVHSTTHALHVAREQRFWACR